MYYSLTISDDTYSINTYDDWHLVPTSRPSFSPPSFNIQTIEIPGRNGLLDVTTALSKYPSFGNRTGNLEFLIHPESPLTWYDTYTKVANYLHGQTKKVSLEDDSAYYYEGRFWLNDFKTGDHYSTITIEYSLSPYKKSKWTTLETWNEDPFGLPDGKVVSDWFKNLESTSSDSWTQIFSSADLDRSYRQTMVGQGPVSPNIIISSDDRQGLDVWFANDELDIHRYIKHFSDGTITDSNIIFSMLRPKNSIRLAVKGMGKVSIEYNILNL